MQSSKNILFELFFIDRPTLMGIIIMHGNMRGFVDVLPVFIL